MKKAFLSFLLLINFVNKSDGQNKLPTATYGTIDRIENMQSQYITSRNIDVWLPEGFSKNEKYAVLYMHDGQMLYDSKTTWNKQSWDVDEVAQKLMDTKKIRPFIVVGIWNGGSTRHADYFPNQPFQSLTSNDLDKIKEHSKNANLNLDDFQPKSDDYLKFIVEELKPLIDSKYPVYTDQTNTFIAGSSMGGLISMYAICEYPQVFSGAACLSTHWVGTYSLENNPIPDSFINYLKDHLPDPNNHKIYFDTGDQTLDALYPKIQKKVDQVMINKGFNNINWLTRYFEGADHSEKSWNARLDIPLTFLLAK